MTLAICLLVVAFGLAMAEVAIPSFGMLALLAATAYTWAVIEAFDAGQAHGWTFLGLGVLLLPVALGLGIKIMPKTPIGRRMMLRGPARDEIKRGSRPDTVHALEGRSGVATSDLRPTGIATIDDERIDVVAGGRFILKGTPLVVVKVEGNRVVVQAQGDSES